jgi:hypothetical protein
VIRPPQNSTRQIIENIQTTTMPRKPRQYRQNLVEQEDRIQLAIQALKNGEIRSIRRGVEVFNVPHPTLRDRLEGRVAQPELYNQNLRLTKTQEEALVE